MVGSKVLASGVALPKVETFQHQSWKRYGNYGAVFTTTTKVGKGMPMMMGGGGDCFHVENEWLIEQLAVGGGGSSSSGRNNRSSGSNIKVSVIFRIVFTKRTMLQ